MLLSKGADQLRGYRESDCVFVFAYAKSRFSHEAAHLSDWTNAQIDLSLPFAQVPHCWLCYGTAHFLTT